jgi:hypothetical protein
MTTLILWNGELMSEDAPLASVQNRALRYGDGFFETMRVHNGRVVFFDAHWQRLLRTAKFLHLDLPAELSRDGLEHQVKRLCMANDIPDARVRLQLLRDGMGTYMPETLKTAWTMQCSPLVSSTFAMNIKGLTVGVYPNAPVPPAPIGNHKTLNALPLCACGHPCQETPLGRCSIDEYVRIYYRGDWLQPISDERKGDHYSKSVQRRTSGSNAREADRSGACKWISSHVSRRN